MPERKGGRGFAALSCRRTPNIDVRRWETLATFASKGHELFAALQGFLRVDSDRTVVDRLWSPSVAAWYPLGKEDPTLALLRFDAERAEIWRHDSSIFDGVRVLFGSDRTRGRANDVAEIRLG